VESQRRVAFVVQRCGEDVVGGAESMALQVAERLRYAYDIEILTTCALDYQTWRNELPEGHSYVRDVHVRRFPVDRPRSPAAFDRLSARIAGDPAAATLEQQEEWMRAQGPLSTQLFRYIADYGPLYDVVAFFTYLYATTYFGLPGVAKKAVLVPFAHDEWPIRLSMWDDVFAAPRALVYSTDEERDFLMRRFERLPQNSAKIGVGVEPPPDLNPERFRKRFDIDEPFLLYLGRIEKSKGVDVLFDDFTRYRRGATAPLKLVLVGRAHTAIPDHPDIVAVGQVDERTKWDALAACNLLVMPSQYESLSLVLLEAWSCAKPVLVNARSSVLVGQCRRAQGGIWYDSYEEFEVALDLFDRELRERLGRQGQEHVRSAYNWSDTVLAYRDILDAVPLTAFPNGAFDHERSLRSFGPKA
jgi:glycosyltransferase involved in cell wall biosynthesis